ncbi:MAG: efflux RND transporter periplasmic adaptor subunit [Desulfoplanes sp.]
MTDAVKQAHPWWKKIAGILVPLLIIGAGIAGAKYFIDTRPKPKKKPPVTLAPLVNVQKAMFAREQVVVQAMGTVVPARKTVLNPQVSGEVIAVSPGFMPGGILTKGHLLLKIDPRDYELQVRQKKTALVQARAALALEQGQQDVARKEWTLLRGSKSMDSKDAALALREPQLAQARAKVDDAALALEQAELDLARTSVPVPFNALILEKNIDLGAQVSTQTTIATLVGTDAYWVETSIPRDRLAWIVIPKAGHGQGSPAVIRSSSGETIRSGRVVRLLGDIEAEGRMARILIQVEDPLLLQQKNSSSQPLLLGEYVRLSISGKVLEHVVAMPRDALRDGNTVWIVKGDDTLDIRSVDVAWRDEQVVYLSKGVEPGDRIVLSDIAAPVTGMALQVKKSDKTALTRTPEGQGSVTSL